MNVNTFGQAERSWASSGARAAWNRRDERFANMRVLWRLVALEGALGAGVTTIFPVFRFPRAVHVVGLRAFTLAATTAQLQGLEFGIVGSTGGQIVTNGRFDTTAPAGALMGPQFGEFLLDMDQPRDTQWIWTLKNTTGAPISPIFLLAVEPPVRT